MLFKRLFRFATKRPLSLSQPQPSVRLSLETLEDRCLPSLTPAVNYPATASYAVVTADFNNDGNLDLATAGGGTVSVLLGEGDGTFAAARHFASPSAYGDLAVGDFNGDGNTDLVTRYNWWGSETVVGGIDMLLGNGDGTFQAAQPVPIPPPESDYGYDSYAPVGMRVADVNGDGRSDLGVEVVYVYFIYYDFNVYYGEYFAVLLGAADGSFESGTVGPEDFPPTAVAPDLNADGYGDSVRATFDGVGVRLGRADGTFAPELLFRRANPRGAWRSGTSTGTGVRTWPFPTPGRTTCRSCSTTGPGPTRTSPRSASAASRSPRATPAPRPPSSPSLCRRPPINWSQSRTARRTRPRRPEATTSPPRAV